MPDEPEEEPKQTTYTPRRTREETVTLEAPHGEKREVAFKIYAGTTYQILEGEEANEVIGWGAVNQNHPAIRRKAADEARS